MGKKIFVSYKYSDTEVQKLEGFSGTTVRDYVDIINHLLEADHHIFKGEYEGEDLSMLEDSTISSKLGDKIFDSSVTIVLISKGMKDNTPEKNQWIPWEISYSLREQSREGSRSKSNAVLAIALPDTNGRYNYYIEEDNCKCKILRTDFLFQIMRDNMFNMKNPVHTKCENHQTNRLYKGHASYIHSVKWSDFISDTEKYINIVTGIQQRIHDYEITKLVK